ncbi:hypothetical protein [Lactobacillus sp.]|uniref:hypothetical protein n=1 Tax=Lactobacillus sp. TaxID=1591 RepID=UPI0025E48582|nr:hypothetical protein [Lactobacillus sp.]MCO6533770.1 hypothetical protein [Lactobacillus sp.]
MKTTIDDIHIYVNIDSLPHIILLVLIVLVLIVFIGFIIDHNTTYDNSKLFRKIKKRTGANTIGGGQEYYLRYWVWQRKKRIAIINLLSSMTRDRFYYPGLMHLIYVQTILIIIINTKNAHLQFADTRLFI